MKFNWMQLSAMIACIGVELSFANGSVQRTVMGAAFLIVLGCGGSRQ